MTDSLIVYISCAKRRQFVQELQNHGEVVTLHEGYGRHSPKKHHIIIGTVKYIHKFVCSENGSLIKLMLSEYCRNGQKGKLFNAFMCNEFATKLSNISLQVGDCIALSNAQVENNTELKSLPYFHDLQAILGYKEVDGAKIFLMKASENVEGSSLNDKAEKTHNSLPRTAPRKFDVVDKYKYTKISDIAKASSKSKNIIHMYGVVKEIIKIEVYNNKLDGRVFRSKDIVIFPQDCKDCKGARSTAHSYHFTASDAARLTQLRRWVISQSSASRRTIESLDQGPTATLLKDITEEGRYIIVCKFLNKEATSDGPLVLTVVDGTLYPILNCHEVKITVTDPPEQFKQLKVRSLVSLGEVTARKNDPHTAQCTLCFTMSGPDCFYETLKRNDRRTIQLKRRIIKMKQPSDNDTPLNEAEEYLCRYSAGSTSDKSKSKKLVMRYQMRPLKIQIQQ